MNEMEQSNAPAATPVEAAPAAAPAVPAVEAQKDTAITIDDFMKAELRVAQIKVAERIPKADKLLRLEVDLGNNETRQILSGIAEHYTPEELIGRRIVIVANLAPRKMRGLESHGMLLAASVGDGDKPVLATVPDDAVLGSRVR
jgi:methionyl-tRNA synthetase